MVADLMKFEVVYNHGGVYADMNYEAFRTLEPFLHYPAVFGNENTYLVPNGISLGYYAAEKG